MRVRQLRRSLVVSFSLGSFPFGEGLDMCWDTNFLFDRPELARRYLSIGYECHVHQPWVSRSIKSAGRTCKLQ
jgi:hypothetical protein